MKNTQLQLEQKILAGALIICGLGAVALAFTLPTTSESAVAAAGKSAAELELTPLAALMERFSKPVVVTKPGENQPVFISRMIGYYPANGKIEPVDKTKELPGVGITPLWLLRYGLGIDDMSVRDADPDVDGFSNLEEYQGLTDPTDKLSRPPIITKLRVKKFTAIPFSLEFRGLTQGAENIFSYQLSFKGKSRLLKENDIIEGYRIGKYQKKEVEKFNEKTNSKEVIDVSELEVTFLKLNETLTLVLRKTQESDESTVDLVLQIPEVKVEPSTVKRGDNFKILGTEYQLVKAGPEGAVIRPAGENDPQKLIKVPMLGANVSTLSP